MNRSESCVGHTVLIAAPERAARSELAHLATSAGYRLAGIAAEKEHAVIVALLKRPDVAIVDADHGGIAIAERLRSEVRVKLLVAMGDLEPVLLQQLLGIDAEALLRKPIRPIDLINGIELARRGNVRTMH